MIRIRHYIEALIHQEICLRNYGFMLDFSYFPGTTNCNEFRQIRCRTQPTNVIKKLKATLKTPY